MLDSLERDQVVPQEPQAHHRLVVEAALAEHLVGIQTLVAMVVVVQAGHQGETRTAHLLHMPQAVRVPPALSELYGRGISVSSPQLEQVICDRFIEFDTKP